MGDGVKVAQNGSNFSMGEPSSGDQREIHLSQK